MTKEKIIKYIKIILIVVVIFFLAWHFYLYPKIVFKENEKKLKEAGIKYYEINSTRLPKEEGRVISVSLDTLTKQKYLKEDLKTANGKKLCDLTASNVKTTIKNGKYVYYTYLKCGSLESRIDHEGPKITLNGKKTITISKDSSYNELGVKSVTDNTDGTIDTSKVTIEGEVDTAKVGIYKITYEAKDSLDNKTVVTRTVKVEETLASIVKKDTMATNNYYQGSVTNNYLMFNNMLFRLVKLNSDNSVLIVSDESLANVDYNGLNKWLNTYFYNLLDKKYQAKIQNGTWCNDTVSKENINTFTTCQDNSLNQKVGLLSIADYNNSLATNSSYLDTTNLTWYQTKASTKEAWAMTISYPDLVVATNMNQLANVSPALNLKASTKVLGGTGTINDPYIIVKPNHLARNTAINKAQIGEYVSYSGYTFRISNIENNLAEVIMTSVLKNNDVEVLTGYTNTTDKIYNPNEQGNLGYEIKNIATKYIKTNLFTKHKVTVPIYTKEVTYKGKKENKEYNLLVTIPSTFDIYSAKTKESENVGYWLIDSVKEANTKTIIRGFGTLSSYVPDNTMVAIKIKAYLDKNVIIADGSGTITDPYKLTK